VAAGDFYHPETESVPEQTWSSAGFYSATVHGLLGLQVDAAQRRLTFAPHLPPDWDHASLDTVRIGESILKLHLSRSRSGIELAVENRGSAVSIDFRPEVPIGAADVNASLQPGERKASRLHVSVERHAQDEHVVAAFTAERGNTHCRIRFRGGVQVSVPQPELRIGDPDRGLKMADVSLNGQTLNITAYLRHGGDALFTVRSQWRLTGATGAEVEKREGDLYRMVLQTPSGGVPSAEGGYVKTTAELRFTNR
jgi:hypothetical protein